MQDVQEKCSNMDDEWTKLQSEIVGILGNSEADPSWQAIIANLNPVHAKLTEVQSAVKHKSLAYNMWLKHARQCADAHERISQLEGALYNAELTPGEMAQLQSDLELARDQLKELDLHEAKMKITLKEADIVFKDRSTESAVDTRSDVERLLSKVADTGLHLSDKSEKLAQITETRQQFDAVKETLACDLEKLREQVEGAQVKEFTRQSVKDVIEQLRQVQLQQSISATRQHQLQTISEHLAAVDPVSVNQAKAEFSVIEADWHAMAACVSQRLDSAVEAEQQWEAFDDTKTAMNDTLKKTVFLLQDNTPCDSLQLLQKRVEFLKVCLYLFSLNIN